jgi:hypothetical protein
MRWSTSLSLLWIQALRQAFKRFGLSSGCRYRKSSRDSQRIEMTMVPLMKSGALNFFLLIVIPFAGAVAQSSPEKLYLCGLLEAVDNGDDFPATVSGVYYSAFEHQVLYDPDHPECKIDVQPSTWVEFSPAFKDKTRLSQFLERDNRAYVTFRGRLIGPDGHPGPDDPSVPWMISYSKRLSHRYGHMGLFRTKFVADEVLEARPVPASLPFKMQIGYSKDSPFPEVESAQVPRYPSMAYRSGISGEVDIEVKVRDGKVVETTAKSGDRMLSMETEENIRSWKFSPDVTWTFTTKFIYSLERPPIREHRKPKIELELPMLVKITAQYYAW